MDLYSFPSLRKVSVSKPVPQKPNDSHWSTISKHIHMYIYTVNSFPIFPKFFRFFPNHVLSVSTVFLYLPTFSYSLSLVFLPFSITFRFKKVPVELCFSAALYSLAVAARSIQLRARRVEAGAQSHSEAWMAARMAKYSTSTTVMTWEGRSIRTTWLVL